MRMDYMDECPTILREYFGYMETIKGKSEKTVEGYFIDLRSFFRYLKMSRGFSTDDFEKIKIDDVTLEMIESVSLTEVFEYMNYLKTVRNNNNNTRSRKCSSLRSFYKYLFTWLTLLVSYLGFKKKDKLTLFLTVPCMAIIMTLLIATPVFAEFRYAYSLFCCLPFLGAIALVNDNDMSDLEVN